MHPVKYVDATSKVTFDSLPRAKHLARTELFPFLENNSCTLVGAVNSSLLCETLSGIA